MRRIITVALVAVALIATGTPAQAAIGTPSPYRCFKAPCPGFPRTHPYPGPRFWVS